MTEQDNGAGTVRVERTFDAPADAVFDAWTNPEVLRRWWKAAPTHEVDLTELDVRVGGGYRLAMRNTESGEDHEVYGTYREVSRPDRLVYSWAWEGTGPYAHHESEVAVTFAEHEPGRTTAWGAFLGGLGDALVDAGNPFGGSASLGDGAAAGLTGYSIVSAGSLEEATEKAKGAPVLANGGGVEVYETIEVM